MMLSQRIFSSHSVCWGNYAYNCLQNWEKWENTEADQSVIDFIKERYGVEINKC